MNGVGGYAGWRWIFILEGLLTVAIAIVAYFVMYDFPDTASFLTIEERAWAVHRLKYQGSKKSGRMIAESDKFEWKFVRQALTDWQLYLCLLVSRLIYPHLSSNRHLMVLRCTGVSYAHCMAFPSSFQPLSTNLVIQVLLPHFCRNFVHMLISIPAQIAQLLTIPIYLTAAALCVVVCYFSDKAAKAGRSRSPYVFGPMVAILVGFIMASKLHHIPWIRSSIMT